VFQSMEIESSKSKSMLGIGEGILIIPEHVANRLTVLVYLQFNSFFLQSMH